MNGRSYNIKNSFYVNGWTILTLDKEIPLEEYRNAYVRIGENKVPYSMAHEGPLIAIEGEHNYTGQTLSFIN